MNKKHEHEPVEKSEKRPQPHTNEVGDKFTSIKRSVIIETGSVENKTLHADDANLKGQTVVENQIELLVTDLDVEEALGPRVESRSHSKLKKISWLLATILVIVLSIAELYSAISLVLSKQDWMAGGWLIVFAIVLTSILGFAYRELRSLQHLKQQEEMQQQAVDLFNTPAIGLGQTHCEAVASKLPSQFQPLVDEWNKGLQSHYTNTEVLSLFELKVLTPIDKIALNRITSNASAAGVMIAVSPFAMLDMLIVLWRNIKMVNQLSSLYGIRLGYWGRVALIKKIFRSMLYAGAAEILSDAGNYALGVGLTGKISTKVAQGLGAGVLTTRIGLKALHECRPMPWLSVKKPGVSHMTKQLLEDLSRFMK